MGRIFTPNEIRDHQIPTIADFDILHGIIKASLTECTWIVGATKFGSYFYGDHNLRSDLDLIVIYWPQDRDRLFHLLRRIKTAAAMSYVPLKFILVDAVIGRLGMHSLNNDIIRHIIYTAERGGLISGEIKTVLIFNPNGTNAKNEIINYLRHKLDRLEKADLEADIEGDENYCRSIQKALEVTSHIMRKVAFWLMPGDGDDRKGTVYLAYKSLATSYEIRLAESLMALDQEYNKKFPVLLESTAYRQYLDSLFKRALPLACEFVKANIYLFKDR